MDIENTKRSQVKIQKTAGVEQCFPGWVSNLDGRSTHDGATARGPRYQVFAPQRFLVWNGGSGPLPLLGELVMAHQGWQTDGQAQRAKIRCRKRREPGTMRSEQVPSSKSQKAGAGQGGLADLVAVVPFGSPKDLSPTPIATPTTGRSQA